MTAEPAGVGRTCAVLGLADRALAVAGAAPAAYAHLGLDWTYERHEVVADGLAGFVAGCGPDWRGLSLTMPLKEAALALGEVDELARLAEASNTLIFDDARPAVVQHRRRRAGERAHGRWGGRASGRRSSAPGRRPAPPWSRWPGWVLAEVTVVARTPAKAAVLVPLAETARRPGCGCRPGRSWSDRTDLLVSTVNAGAADDRADELAGASAAVFDVIYHPWPTPLAQAAVTRDRVVLNGLDLLVHQALLQIELMTGSSVPAAVLYQAGHAALAVG